MSVSLSPKSCIGFNRPLTRRAKRTLVITNKNDQPVAFKVKTTDPMIYLANPTSGRIEPKESIEVQILKQAIYILEEIPLSAECKDKLLVQSAIITQDKESIPLRDFWRELDGSDGQMHKRRVKVVYLPPVGQVVEERKSHTASIFDDGSSTVIGGTSGIHTVH